MSKEIQLNDTVYAYKVFVEDDDKVHVQIYQGTLASISYRGRTDICTISRQPPVILSRLLKSRICTSRRRIC